jgi:hypothetical protein
MRKRVILVLILFLLPVSVFAGEYVLVNGKGVEVCEAYKKNLESFNEPRPMACERKINTNFKDFEKPVWEKVDLEKHRELFRRVLKYYSTTGNIYFGKTIAQFGKSIYDDETELNSRIKDHKESGYSFIKHTRIDIDNDTKPDDVLIYRDNPCPDGPPFHSSNLYLLLEDPSVKDAMICSACRAEDQLRKEISQNSGTDTTVDVFRYKSVTYIDKYCLSKQPGCMAKDTLIVYKYGSVRDPKAKSVLDEWKTGFHKICEYQYKNNK